MSKLIYELPIYAMQHKKFMKSWTAKVQRLHKNLKERRKSEKYIKNEVFSQFYPRYIYEYNQIIGYFNIILNEETLSYKLHLTYDDKNFRPTSKTKNFIGEIDINNYHSAIKKKSNLQISEIIIKDIGILTKKYLKETYYVDYTIFNNTIDYLDLNSLKNLI
jgi:uncharacterized protein VirK/YbjX